MGNSGHCGPNPEAPGESRGCCRFHLTTGHNFLGVYLHWLGVVANVACSICDRARMDGDHLLQCTGLVEYPADDIVSRYWELSTDLTCIAALHGGSLVVQGSYLRFTTTGAQSCVGLNDWRAQLYPNYRLASTALPKLQTGEHSSTQITDWRAQLYPNYRLASTALPKLQTGEHSSTQITDWRAQLYPHYRLASTDLPTLQTDEHRSTQITDWRAQALPK
ncbi:reverse transcriptase [Trichonephila clavipes]|nr:reverse transcriptase [Trichonephila clavipes]